MRSRELVREGQAAPAFVRKQPARPPSARRQARLRRRRRSDKAPSGTRLGSNAPRRPPAGSAHAPLLSSFWRELHATSGAAGCTPAWVSSLRGHAHSQSAARPPPALPPPAHPHTHTHPRSHHSQGPLHHPPGSPQPVRHPTPPASAFGTDWPPSAAASRKQGPRQQGHVPGCDARRQAGERRGHPLITHHLCDKGAEPCWLRRKQPRRCTCRHERQGLDRGAVGAVQVRMHRP